MLSMLLAPHGRIRALCIVRRRRRAGFMRATLSTTFYHDIVSVLLAV